MSNPRLSHPGEVFSLCYLNRVAKGPQRCSEPFLVRWHPKGPVGSCSVPRHRSGWWVLAGAEGARPGEGISHRLTGAEHVWDRTGWDGGVSLGLWLFLNERWGRSKWIQLVGAAGWRRCCPWLDSQDARGSGGVGTSIAMYPTSSCLPSSSRPGQDDTRFGSLWKQFLLPTGLRDTHVAPGYPVPGHGTPSCGHLAMSTRLALSHGTQCGVLDCGTARWGTPQGLHPDPPSLSPQTWAASELGNPQGNPFPGREETRQAGSGADPTVGECSVGLGARGRTGGLFPWPEQHLLTTVGVSSCPQPSSHGLPQLPAGAHQLPCLEQGPDP